VEPGFPPLLPHDSLKVVALSLGEPRCHTTGIGMAPRLPVSKLMARGT